MTNSTNSTTQLTFTLTLDCSDKEIKDLRQFALESFKTTLKGLEVDELGLFSETKVKQGRKSIGELSFDENDQLATIIKPTPKRTRKTKTKKEAIPLTIAN